LKNYLELNWLPPLSTSFKQECSILRESENCLGISIQNLARHRLDENKLSILGRLIHEYQKNGKNIEPLRPLSIGLISNANFELFKYPIMSSAARYGISLTVYDLPFGSAIQQGLDPNSYINLTKPDIILISLDYRMFFPSSGKALPGIENLAENISTQMLELAESFRRFSGAVIMMASLAPPPENIFGNFDRRQRGSLRQTIHEVNERLIVGLKSGDLIIDIEALAANVGYLTWFDFRQWNHAKLPFSFTCLPLFADHVARLLAAHCGKSKKCLVLDIDNTLWGGVIGDDGIEGITLGCGNSIGEAYVDFQEYILKLRDRGIILAICSKNVDSIVSEVFSLHPECLLKKDDFAAFYANWDDKPSNLRRIADELSIGLDSLVFFDDSPFEREMVRKFIPEVVVLEVPSDPSRYREILSQSGWFESITYTEDDRGRNEQYKSNISRSQLSSSTDIETYLRSLEMKLFAEPFNLTNRQRVTQLINKTNQFNLTTRRYNEHQVKIFEDRNNSSYCEAFRLTDNFGDNGIIGIMICKEFEVGRWIIDTFLMSCRVLNRQVEHAIMSRMIDCALKLEIQSIDGEYIPTGRNEMVKNLYEQLGFFCIKHSLKSDDHTQWRLNLEDYKKRSTVNIEILVK
jgi:FkbH-like protein